MNDVRGLGAIVAPEFPKLYSIGLLRRAWQLRHRLRGHSLAFLGKNSLWSLLCFGVLYFLSERGQNESLLLGGWILSLVGFLPIALSFLGVCCKALIPSAQPNWSSLWGILARVLGTGLLFTLPLLIMSSQHWEAAGAFYTLCVYFPAVVFFYGWCWCHQFLYCVTVCEGQSPGLDMQRARQLIQGAHLELLLGYILTQGILQLVSLAAIAGLLVVLGIPAFLLATTGFTYLAAGLGGLGYLLTAIVMGTEVSTFFLAYHLVCYAQLRQRRDGVADLIE